MYEVLQKWIPIPLYCIKVVTVPNLEIDGVEIDKCTSARNNTGTHICSKILFKGAAKNPASVSIGSHDIKFRAILDAFIFSGLPSEHLLSTQ